MIVPVTPQQISRAAELLGRGELVAFPTETVYGLGANAMNAEAVLKVFRAKGRPSNNPLILHVRDAARGAALFTLTDPDTRRRFDALARLWPGPLTIVAPKSDAVGRAVSAGLPTAAVRVPAHPAARMLLEAVDFPIAAPSANPSSYVSPTTAAHVAEGLGNKVSLILDGGPCSVGVESTIISIAGPTPRVLRYGAIGRRALEEALGEPVQTPSIAPAPSLVEAPGMMARHYAPRTPVRFLSEVAIADLPARVGLITFGPSPQDPGTFDYTAVSTLSSTGGLEEVARNLFAALREHDRLDLDLILVDSCPEDEGLGCAIMDRLKRATSRA